MNDAITLCEIKHSTKPFTIDKAYAKALRHKMQVFKEKTQTNKHLFMTIVAVHGIKDNDHSDGLITKVVTLNDLFRGEIEIVIASEAKQSNQES